MAQKYVLGPNAAREFKRLMHKSPGVSRRDGASGALAFDAEYDQPFAVRWAQSVNSGDGAWIIWLPSSDCLVVNGEAIDMTSELTDAGGDYPTGWYQLDCLDDTTGGSLYLNVHVPKPSEDDEETGETSGGEEEESEVTANFADSEDEAEDDETVWPVLIATCSGRDVKQTVTSAVIIGGGATTGDCVKSLNDEDGDMDIIGGQHIVVETNGKTIKVSYDEDKEDDDEDPNNEDDPCEHPDAGGGAVIGGFGGGGGGVPAEGVEGNKGDGCCGGSSTVGGSATGTGTGTTVSGAGVTAGSSGKSGSGASSNGKEATVAPSGSSADSSSGGVQASGGLFNGSTVSKSKIESVSAHGSLTSTKTMNQSPFAASGSARTVEQTQASSKTSIYGGTHNQLTSTKTMNSSPFKK